MEQDYQPELLEPKPNNDRLANICAVSALLFAALALLVIFFIGKTAHADEPEIWQVWECPSTDKQCLLDNGVPEVEADLITENAYKDLEPKEPEIIYLEAPEDWYIVCYDRPDPVTLEWCEYVEVHQNMIDKYGLPQSEEGWEALDALVQMTLFPLDTELDG